MRRIWKIALIVAILAFWISFFALAWLVVGVFVFSSVTARLPVNALRVELFLPLWALAFIGGGFIAAG